MADNTGDEMTNEEIRIKIAQAKGCHWYEVRGSAYLCSDSSRMMIDREAVRVDEPDPDSKLHFKVPNWPENIADAWELVEEMPFYQIYKSQLVTGQPYYGCMCFMRLPCDEDNPDYIGEAGAVPRAICLAWLAWDAARKAGK